MSNRIRVLFLAANPTDTARLRLDEESRAIDHALQQTEFRALFDLQVHFAVRILDLQTLLLRHKPDIVHFGGHGSHTNEILVEDENGKSQSLSSSAFSSLFNILKDNIKCVLLNGCCSDHQARAIAEHIDCVIGMSNDIYDKAAIRFSIGFYQGLGYGRSIQTAFNLGCLQLDLENYSKGSIPKLYCDNNDPAKISFVDHNDFSFVRSPSFQDANKHSFRSRVEINLPGNLQHIPPIMQQAAIDAAVGALAGALKIPRESIEVLHVRVGSIIIELRMPSHAIEQLILLHESNSAELDGLQIQNITLPLLEVSDPFKRFAKTKNVNTSVAAFVGFTERAEYISETDPLQNHNVLHTPINLHSWEEYYQYFGGFSHYAYLPYAVHGFFENGGKQCYVISIRATYGTCAKAILYDGQVPTTPRLIIESKSRTEDGNNISIKVESYEEESPAYADDRKESPFSFDYIFTLIVNYLGKPVEKFSGVMLASGAYNVAEIVNKQSEYIKATILDSVTSLTIEESTANSQSFSSYTMSLENGIYELYGGENGFIDHGLLDGTSDSLILEENVVGLIEGNTARGMGIGALGILDDVQLVCAPDLALCHEFELISGEDFLALQASLLDHCENKGDRIAILDTPYRNWDTQSVLEWREHSVFDSSYGAIFYPWIAIAADPNSGNEDIIYVPPCGHIAGTYARVALERGVPTAVVNFSLHGALDVLNKPTQDERQFLRAKGINSINKSNQQGIFLEGGRTLSSDPKWRFIHTRRLVNYIQTWIKVNTKWVVSYINNRISWQLVNRQITAFLRDLWQDGTLFGVTSDDAFYVRCDDEINPPELRGKGIFIIEVGIVLTPDNLIEFAVKHEI